ncbi:dienelactone hydrolase family protein [Actinopolyspora mortivallis]|uniref:Dienelactone hydrolase n=1 Tax=Actinopolyspora mortivallis TaxID=33906 RepID=A0A2T0GX06_ACTMO|nr:dienelactone hydrolase family protein [Actinopolyspora mortivallis]PRW63627.1 dienelactone hydrolase [Actinopolyspora mortivallis]
MTAVRTSSVDIPTADGVADAYLTHPEDTAAHPGVLLYMDAFGIRPHLTAMADRLASSGYTVVVPNVFYRHGRTPVVELPEFIDPHQRPDIFERIGPIMRELTPERAVRDAGAYLEWMTTRPEVANGPVGVTGYCMGAALAMRTAAAHPDRVAAAACFHGGNLATEDPDSPHRLAEHITAELYFGHADQDHALPPEQIERLDRALTEAGVRYRAEVYEGAAHGYTQADTASYDRDAAERHWTELLALLDRALNSEGAS